MNIHYLQHVPFEDLGVIRNWATDREHSISVTKFFIDESIPNSDKLDWLIIMGGPMNVYEEKKYPWLINEKLFIEKVIKQNKIVIGICLGAQLIADVLGAKVYPNKEKEIGWFPISWTKEAKTSEAFNFVPDESLVFHWHGDTFDLPLGCQRIVKSDVCENQGFISKNEKVIALQFHMEITRNGVMELINNCSNELVSGKYIQRPEELLNNNEGFNKLNNLMFQFLDRLENYQTKRI